MTVPKAVFAPAAPRRSDPGGALATPTRRSPPRSFAVAIVGSWIAIAAAELSGHGSILHHDAIVHSPRPVLAVVTFLVAWQAMIGAMMLPSTVPMLSLFRVAADTQERPRLSTATFVAGYLAVWTAFGAAALTFDLGVHRTVDHNAWLTAHTWLVAAATLLVAGTFQFTPLRERCLRVCRHPVAYLMHHYRPGLRGAFALGVGHGRFCLGCCWAIMLLMFGVGLTNLVWMGALTAVMVYEKVGRRGETVARSAGIVLVGWGLLVALQPAWLPHALAGAAR
jgi:predicted metal-binding membrane protein